MAAQDFSHGHPRNGQWVHYREFIGVCTGPATGSPDTKSIAKPIMDKDGSILFGVGIVGEDGFTPVQRVNASLKDLKPLLDKNLIPEPRRKTLRPDWTPRP